ALRFRHQSKVYGPIVEDSPELRKIQKLAVEALVKLMEREFNDGPPKGQLGVTGAALGALQTFPLEAGRPAVAVVAKIAAQPTNPNRVAALDVLKKWGSANCRTGKSPFRSPRGSLPIGDARRGVPMPRAARNGLPIFGAMNGWPMHVSATLLPLRPPG